jgi:hypothetical protein
MCLNQDDRNRVWEAITYAVLQLRDLHEANYIDNNNYNNEPCLLQPQQPQPSPVRTQSNRTQFFLMILMMRKKRRMKRYHWLNKWQQNVLLQVRKNTSYVFS